MGLTVVRNSRWSCELRDMEKYTRLMLTPDNDSSPSRCNTYNMHDGRTQSTLTSVNSRRPSAFASAWWRHCPETVFRDNFVTLHHRSKRIAFLESVNVSTCVCMQIFEFSWWSRDHFSAPFRGLYLPNAWSQTLQTRTRLTFSFTFSAFHRYHWFGVKLFL